MAFRTIKAALSSLLAANAAGRFFVEGFQRQSHAAEEMVGTHRHVTVFYRSGQLPKGSSGWLAGPYKHAMTFQIELILSAPATVDLRVLQNPGATPQELMSALAAQQAAARNADAQWDELADFVWNILMDARNASLGLTTLGIADRWVGNVQKENPAPMGEYVLLSGTMDYTCTAVERAAGAVGIPAGTAVDVTLTETADITGAATDSAAQGARSS